MRIVYSIPTRIGAGGLGVDSFEALKGIYSRGYLEKVVAYGNRQKEIPSSYFRNVGWFNPTRPFSNLPSRYYYPLKRKHLDRLAKREIEKGADLFHGWSSSSLESLRACRKRGIVSLLENPGPHCVYAEKIHADEYAHLGIRRRNLPEILPAFFGQDEEYHLAEYEEARYIILESDFTRDTFAGQGVPEDKLVVIPRGVDTARFVPPRKRAPRPFRAVFMGAVCVRKGVRILLEAWTSLGLKDAKLLLVGSVRDEIQPLLQRSLPGNPSVELVGFVPDPVRLYQEASVFVFPSLSEGSAKVCYEAMSCGLPVIVTPNAGSVVRDGRDGFIVPVRDPDALREKILLLYENPDLRETMGREARRHMETFTWDAHRNTLIETYEKVFGNGPA